MIENLSASEERNLIRRAQQGSRRARDRLWVAFHPFAVSQARRQARRKGIDRDSAESEASIVILEAIERFDLQRDCRFSTYLSHRVRGSITTVARDEVRSKFLDIARFEPAKIIQRTPPRAAPGLFWSTKVVEWARRLRRKNDRLMIKWLWFDSPPKTQAEIARQLSVSRSAVCQRRHTLMKRILEKDPNTLFDQTFTEQSLNTFSAYSYMELDY